jgi:hypothetical protein
MLRLNERNTETIAQIHFRDSVAYSSIFVKAT